MLSLPASTGIVIRTTVLNKNYLRDLHGELCVLAQSHATVQNRDVVEPSQQVRQNTIDEMKALAQVRAVYSLQQQWKTRSA